MKDESGPGIVSRWRNQSNEQFQAVSGKQLNVVGWDEMRWAQEDSGCSGRPGVGEDVRVFRIALQR